MTIEIIHRVQVEYEAKIKEIEKIEMDFFSEMKRLKHVHNTESFSGGAACGPYLTVECKNSVTAFIAENLTAKIIKKNNGKVIY